MSEAYKEIWKELGLDLERHDCFLAILPEAIEEVLLKQPNRPQGMAYFDGALAEAHGARIKEVFEHKKAGGLLVGTFCVFVPEELIFAANGIAVGLCGGAQFTVPTAEQILPRNLCPLIKSFVGFKLERICPYTEGVDFLIGETTCDGKKKVYEIFNEYKPVYVMELPQKKNEEDLYLWEREIWRLKEKIEQHTGQEITAEKLLAGIKKGNARRAALARLYETRKADPVPISGKDSLLISQLAFFDDPDRFTAQVNQLCEELEDRMVKGIGVVEKGTPRILVSGTPMALPYWKLHHIVENSGAIIVAEETCTGTRYFAGQVSEEGQTVEEHIRNLARRMKEVNCAVFTPNEERLQDVLRLYEEYKADGVIHLSLQFCQPYCIEARKIEKALKERNIPVLVLESDYSAEDIGQLKTRIDAFLEMIAAQKVA